MSGRDLIKSRRCIGESPKENKLDRATRANELTLERVANRETDQYPETGPATPRGVRLERTSTDDRGTTLESQRRRFERLIRATDVVMENSPPFRIRASRDAAPERVARTGKLHAVRGIGAVVVIEQRVLDGIAQCRQQAGSCGRRPTRWSTISRRAWFGAARDRRSAGEEAAEARRARRPPRRSADAHQRDRRAEHARRDGRCCTRTRARVRRDHRERLDARGDPPVVLWGAEVDTIDVERVIAAAAATSPIDSISTRSRRRQGAHGVPGTRDARARTATVAGLVLAADVDHAKEAP